MEGSGAMISGNVLITGGTGTLGKVILSLAKEEKWPCSFTVYSRSELLQAQMKGKFPDVRYVLGDIRDYNRLEAAIAGHSVVIHAAAMKRIPEADEQPLECFKTNIQGTENVIRACISQRVKRCVGISTDKACRAITMYGASKLALEKMFLSAPLDPCKFSAVRYGNVISSRGSVIPLWRKQASNNSPLTITDREMTRFWMSPRDAGYLVLQSLSEDPRTILVPKLKSLSISEMANIIAPGCETVEVGLRSVEKKHEDLLHTDEEAEETETQFRIGRGWAGRYYTSYMAPRLTRNEFLKMIEEAERYE